MEPAETTVDVADLRRGDRFVRQAAAAHRVVVLRAVPEELLISREELMAALRVTATAREESPSYELDADLIREAVYALKEA